jgi:8-oxo-dGTP pyrophosphatase MutT (NUDIX family)
MRRVTRSPPGAPEASQGPLGPRLLVVAGLVWLDTRLLVQRRSPSASHGASMLELPGGKLERGESPREALMRELVEEWGEAAAQLEVGRVADVLHHVYPAPGPEVVLIVLHVDANAWLPDWRMHVRPEQDVEVLAFERHELPCEQFLAADRPFLEAVRRGSISRTMG